MVTAKSPAPEAALEAGVSRERLVRLIQTRAVSGQRIAGKWYVDRGSLHEYLARQDGSGHPAGAA